MRLNQSDKNPTTHIPVWKNGQKQSNFYTNWNDNNKCKNLLGRVLCATFSKSLQDISHLNEKSIFIHLLGSKDNIQYLQFSRAKGSEPKRAHD